ncbi:MAG: hypothetical protein KKE59_06490 [Proteobacteria bacterium]|nr:hypothetical protein [Pseudomonadota bacterium]
MTLATGRTSTLAFPTCYPTSLTSATGRRSSRVTRPARCRTSWLAFAACRTSWLAFAARSRLAWLAGIASRAATRPASCTGGMGDTCAQI